MSRSRLDRTIRSLKERLACTGGLLVAFSGGVDSAVVARLAHEALADQAVAVTVDSQTFTKDELAQARRLARLIGIRHLVLKHDELKDPKFRKNPPERCYFCRKGMAALLLSTARRLGLGAVADGANLSDLSEHRPGIKAATLSGMLHPLIEAGVDKKGVRRMARRLGLPVHDRPSSACLSSRIPYGEEITEEKLKRVAKAEDFLRRLGFGQVRVRSHGMVARIEVERDLLPRLLRRATAQKVASRLKKLGFVYVTADLNGYRSGSMDEAL